MSKWFLVPVACLALALGVAACGSDDDDNDGGGELAPRRTRRRPTGSTAPVKIALSVPAADHGWLAAVSKDAKAIAENLEGVDLTVNDSATDSAGQADQIETLINEKPDALVVLPNEGEALTPVAQKATAAGHPGHQHRPRVLDPGRLPHLDRRRQLRHRLAGRQLLRRRAQVQGQRRRRSRASPASR